MITSLIPYEFEIVDLSQADSPSDFFSYCLKNQLFKNEEGFLSRMKNTYNNKRDWHGVSAVIAKKDNLPIGICLLEKEIKQNSYLFS